MIFDAVKKAAKLPKPDSHDTPTGDAPNVHQAFIADVTPPADASQASPVAPPMSASGAPPPSEAFTSHPMPQPFLPTLQPPHVNRVDELFKAYKDQAARRRGRKFTNILAVSLITHSVVALAVAYVPAVRNAVQAMTTLSGAEFVEQNYRKTQIEAARNDLEVVAVVNANDLFQYPDGYFMPYHGTEMTAEMAALQPTDPLLATPPVTVEPDAQVLSTAPASAYNPQAFEPLPPAPLPPPAPLKPLPTPRQPRVRTPRTPNTNAELASAANLNNSTSNANNANNASNANLNAANTELSAAEKQAADQAQLELERQAKEQGISLFPSSNAINRKPLLDTLAEAKAKLDAGLININGDVKVEIASDVNAEGKLENIKVTKLEGDKNLAQLALDFIGALNDSNVLAQMQGAKNLRIAVESDKDKVKVVVKSDMDTEDRARGSVSVYSAGIFSAIQFKKGGDEAQAILKQIKLDRDSKTVIVNFEMPRADVGGLLSKQLAKTNQQTKAP